MNNSITPQSVHNSNLDYLNLANTMRPEDYIQYLMSQQNSGRLGATPLPASQPVANSYWDLPIQQRLQAIQSVQQTPDLGQSIRGDGSNIIKNALANAAEIGTGLTYVGTHIPEVLGETGGYIQRNWDNPLKVGKDIINVVGSPYNFNTSDIGKRSVGEILQRGLIGAYEHPVDTAFDVLSLGGGRLVTSLLGKTKAGQKAARTLNYGAAKLGLSPETELQRLVQSGVDVTRQGVADDIRKAVKPLESDSIKKMTATDLAYAVQAAEEGIPVTGKVLEAKNALRELSKNWDDVFKKYSPHTWVDPQDMSIIQKVTRDTGNTYQATRKALTPILDTLKEENGLAKVTELADMGNDAAKRVLDAKQLYDRGEIFPVTHGLAEVDKTKAIDASQRILNKRFSTREFGNASYEDIAKQLVRPSEYLDNLGVNFGNSEIARQIIDDGYIGKSLAPDDIGRAVYVSRESLEQAMRNERDIHSVLKEAKAEKLLDDDIPLDKTAAKILENSTERRGEAFGGIVRDGIRISKQAMLGGGSYIGGNAITAAATGMLNSGPMLISDMLSAVKSRGSLLKKLNLYRTDSSATKMSNAFTQAISNVNNKLGGNILRFADREIQNYWGEVAAHAALRKQGVWGGNKLAAIESMDKAKLGELIHDVRRGGLLNDPYSFLPAWAESSVKITNPFFNWTETATKATLHQMKNHPFLANVALNDILGHVGFDKEMQNRLQLGVQSDKPYVSYKFDDKTGEIKETTAEFVPITASLKFADAAFRHTGEGTPAGIPLLTDLMNAWQGKDRYGRPNKRAATINEMTQTVGSTRWKMNTQTGQVEQINFQGDEVLATAIKDLFVPVNFWNRTVAPIVGGIAGMDYYQPYTQSVFGDFTSSDYGNNFWVGGNADRPRTIDQVLKSVTGKSEYKYYPDRETMTPSQARKFMRQAAQYRANRGM
jgi:hypothetical protein